MSEKFIVQLCALYFSHSAVLTKFVTVCAQCCECQHEEIQKKRGQTAGVTMTLLRIPTTVSVAVDRPASYLNQTISSTRPSCWMQISMVNAIDIAADHQMFMTLTSKLSWHRLRRSAVDFYSKKRRIALWAALSGLRGNVRHSIYRSLESPWSTLYSS